MVLNIRRPIVLYLLLEWIGSKDQLNFDWSMITLPLSKLPKLVYRLNIFIIKQSISAVGLKSLAGL